MKYLRMLIICCLAVLSSASAGAQTASNQVFLRADLAQTTIDRNIYGHFAEHLGRCIYEGIWVGPDSAIPNTRGIRNDVVAALKKIKVPVLRWPGGCFADEYHWKDGIGPREQRPAMINTHWGGVVENNHFGTHEFFDLCEQLECEPYVCGNVGSGTVQEMMEWVEYMTSDANSPIANLRRKNGREKPWKLTYFGVGNESWGCGGNMTPEYYSDQYRRYNTFVKNYAGSRVFRIACGANGADYKWTESLMENAGNRMNGLSLHYYTVPTGNWQNKGSATQYDDSLWHGTLRRSLEMETLVSRHGAIMDKFDPQKRVGMMVDEWGVWHNAEPGTNPGFLYQQNTIRDALVAAISLNIFNQHADRVKMANIAQTINVLQAMILTDKEKIVLTPTYHVFEMYTVHHNARLVPAEVKAARYEMAGESIPMVNVSASRGMEGQLNVTLCNLDPNREAAVTCDVRGMAVENLTGRVLTSESITAHNTFDKPESVKPAPFDRMAKTANGFTATLPPRSVVVVVAK